MLTMTQTRFVGELADPKESDADIRRTRATNAARVGACGVVVPQARD
jgi:hypothetical protein